MDSDYTLHREDSALETELVICRLANPVCDFGHRVSPKNTPPLAWPAGKNDCQCGLQRFAVWLTRFTTATPNAYSQQLAQAFRKRWFAWVNVIANRYKTFGGHPEKPKPTHPCDPTISKKIKLP